MISFYLSKANRENCFGLNWKLLKYENNNNISKLNINGAIIEDQRKIADFCSSFYLELHRSKFSQTAADNFLNSSPLS